MNSCEHSNHPAPKVSIKIVEQTKCFVLSMPLYLHGHVLHCSRIRLRSKGLACTRSPLEGLLATGRVLHRSYDGKYHGIQDALHCREPTSTRKRAEQPAKLRQPVVASLPVSL